MEPRETVSAGRQRQLTGPAAEAFDRLKASVAAIRARLSCPEPEREPAEPEGRATNE